jgi:hypothetical protein
MNSSTSNGTTHAGVGSNKSTSTTHKFGDMSQSMRKANLLKEQLLNTQSSMVHSPGEANNKLFLSTENNLSTFMKNKNNSIKTKFGQIFKSRGNHQRSMESQKDT